MKRNDAVLIVKVIELSSAEIKYRLFDYQDGPLIVSQKWELKRLVLANGFKEFYDSLRPPSLTQAAPKPDLSIITSGHAYIYKGGRIYEGDMLEIARKQNDKKLNLIIKRTTEIRFARRVITGSAIAAGSFGALVYVGVIPLKTPSSSTVSGGGYSGARRTRSANLAYRRGVGGYFMLGALGLEAIALVVNLNEIKHAHLVVKGYNDLISKP